MAGNSGADATPDDGDKTDGRSADSGSSGPAETTPRDGTSTPDTTERQAGHAPEAGGRQEGGVSRRGVLVGGIVAGGIVAGGVVATGGFLVGRRTAEHAPAPAASSPDDGRIHFRSTTVTAPTMTVLQESGMTVPGLLFTTPLSSITKTYNGAIVDEQGEPLWLQPGADAMTDLRVQRYRGRDVLTYWSGEVYKHHGRGTATILDDHYDVVARVKAGGGFTVDLHEFNLTDRGTALITIYAATRADLRPVGGPRQGWVFEGHVQEIDVATGKVLLDWASLDHVPVEESYQGLFDDPTQDGSSAEAAFDYIHLNAVDDDGDALLVSARHTGTIYRIDRTSGEVLWRFGGRKSDIAVPAGGAFAWQHDIRRHDDGTYSLFDNNLRSSAPGEFSRGMVFRIDEAKRTATLVDTYSNEHLGIAMGNVQYLARGHRMVGWGADQHATEFDEGGSSLFDIDLGGASYRVYRQAWHATPSAPPDVAVTSTAFGRLTVSVSWNGATEVQSWRVLAGQGKGSLHPVATHRRAGFETSMGIGTANFVQVEALDHSGTVLGRSAVTPAPGSDS